MPDLAIPSTPPWAQHAGVDVDEFIETSGPLESGGPSWTITDDGAAEWAMAHVAAAETQIAGLRDQRDLWLDQLTRWFDDAIKGPTRTIGFFTGHIQRYAVATRERDPKRKTLALPSGVAPTTEHKPSVIIINDDALIEWAEATVYVDPFHPPHAELGETTTSTYAELGVVKVTKEARISALKPLVSIHDPACEECGGEGSVDVGFPEQEDGASPIETCPACDGRGKVMRVITATGEVVPGVDVDPGGITANTLKPVKAVAL